MTLLDITKSTTINADADRLWQILGEDFLHVSDWVTAIARSDPNPNATNTIAGAPSGGRSCEIAGFGKTDERLTRFDRTTRSFAYTVNAKKIPSFVRDMLNEWTVEDVGNGQARVTSRISADASGPLGALMAPMMKMKLRSTQNEIFDDLVTYAETGRPSAAKQKTLAKTRVA